MDDLVQLIASYLVNSLWEVAVIGGAGWAVSRLLKRLGPGVQHIVWVATLALAVITPAFPSCRSLLASLCLPAIVHNHPAITVVAAQGARPVFSNSLVLPPFLILAISLLYLGTLVYFLARLGWLLHCTTSLLRGACPVSLGAEGDELWSRCRQVLLVKDARILKSHRVAGPVTIGLIHPVLLVPEGFVKECTSHDFLAALAHECAHMKRLDFQKNLFYEIASLLISFHPITWVIKSQIAQTREMICDDMATEKLIDSHTYTESLLRLVVMMSLTAPVPTSSAIGIFDANILEKRIMMMKTKRQHLGSAVKYGMMITGTLLLLMVAGGSGAMARSVETQSPAASVTPAPAKGHSPNLDCTYWGFRNGSRTEPTEPRVAYHLNHAHNHLATPGDPGLKQ